VTKIEMDEGRRMEERGRIRARHERAPPEEEEEDKKKKKKMRARR